MTTKIIEHTIEVKRKRHPNDARYPCRCSQEILQAGMKLMSSLSADDWLKLKTDDMLIEPEETEELFNEIKDADIIGLGILRKTGFSANKYEVKKSDPQNKTLLCENFLTKTEELISLNDLSVGFALGFAEILYRNDEPFGISNTVTLTLQIDKKDGEDEEK